MLKFYRNASILLLALLVISGALIYAGIIKSRLDTSLFPARDKDFMWRTSTEPRAPNGQTSLSLKEELGTIEFEFSLDPQQSFPYVHYSMAFTDAVQPYKIVDLSKYRNISFKIMCDPRNVLVFTLFSFDDKVTDLNDPVTRRVSSKAFVCNDDWTTVNIPLDEIFTPDWWLGRNHYQLGDTGYHQDKVLGFAWTNSLYTPSNTKIHVKLSDVKLQGRDYGHIYATSALIAVIWILGFIWLFRRYTTVLIEDLKEKLKQDQPLIAYKKLSIEPQKDKEKLAVLNYIATEYVNPELSIDTLTTSLGINRAKINDILKEELGLTFSSYLNKLRLTEAARLLSESKDANVSEIAYAVGYNNVSYFNKLFKATYNCAPKTFKDFSLSEKPDA
ncbi:helix-turn-helix domain-containing protein [Cellvibrio sp.]|uniref:helix-turn-helix domain-containing protein n=1 Tax=Cellvibrio sp. TaxID=1965322 RepID=UPI0039648B36